MSFLLLLFLYYETVGNQEFYILKKPKILLMLFHFVKESKYSRITHF